MAYHLTVSSLDENQPVVICDLCQSLTLEAGMERHFEFHAAVLHNAASTALFAPFLAAEQPIPWGIETEGMIPAPLTRCGDAEPHDPHRVYRTRNGKRNWVACDGQLRGIWPTPIPSPDAPDAPDWTT